MIKTGIIDAQLALDILRTDKEAVAYDTETNGLEFSSVVVGYVVTNREFSVYVPVRHGGGGNIPNADDFEAELAGAFADRSRKNYRTVGHNLGFDLRMSLKHGIRLWSPLEDTMINEALIDDRTVGYGLDDCAIRHGVTAKKGDELYRHLANLFGGIPDRKQMQHFWRLPGDDAIGVDYATGDGVSTLELWESQQPILDAEGLRRVWQLECDLMPYLARMHYRGIKIDHNYAEQVDAKIKAMLLEHAAKFEAGFNPRSSIEVERLYRANGYTDDMFARTPSGKTSFTEAWLETNEIGEALLDWRRIEKARDSFITPLVDTANTNGRIHPVLNQSKSDEYGVAGARLSCSSPNMQAQPKRNKQVGKLVRPLVVPDFGYIFEDDFMQQEPRLFTHFAKPPALVEGYMSGTMDIHDVSNGLLFGGADRDKAKRLGMGMLTMLGVAELARRLRCTEKEAKEYKRQFLGIYPEIEEFQREVIKAFAHRRVVKTILGRKARLETERFAYQGVSRVIQNNGGDHMKTALLMANQYEDAYPDEIQILLSIHDSTMFQTESLTHAKEMERILNSAASKLGISIPIPVEVGLGRNWAEASYGLDNKATEWYNAI